MAELRAGLAVILSCAFLPMMTMAASLKVTSFPNGANVYINDVNTGKITPTNITVADGSTVKVTVKIPGSGWTVYESMVPINPGNNDLSVTLIPAVTVGPMGPEGPQGDAGPTGPQGRPGDIGPMGPQGEVGPMGTPGSTGATGAQGADGPIGPTGATGPQGLKGDTGAQGIVGPAGPVGPLGPQGLKGDTGAQGPAGEGIVHGGCIITTSDSPLAGFSYSGDWISTGNLGWVPRASMPTPRGGPCAANIGKKIYVFGGIHPGLPYPDAESSDTEAYDIETNTWETKASLPSKRYNCRAVAVGTKIYVMGGRQNGSTQLAVNDIFDTSTNTWSTGTSMPTARAAFGIVNVAGTIYTLGGYTQNGDKTSVNEVYDLTTDSWSSRAPMTQSKSVDAAAIGEKIYAIGGDTAPTGNWAPTTKNQVYSIPTDSWSSIPDLPMALMHQSVVALNGRIYSIGGWLNPGTWSATNRVFEFDPAVSAWTEIAARPEPLVVEPGYAVVDGSVYLLGGVLPDGVLSGTATNTGANERFGPRQYFVHCRQ